MLLELFHQAVPDFKIPYLKPSYKRLVPVRVADNGVMKNRVEFQEFDVAQSNQHITSSDYSLDNLVSLGISLTPVIMFGGSSVSVSDQFNNISLSNVEDKNI